MKANPDQLAGTRLKADPPATPHSKFHKASSVAPAARCTTWFNSYDEEWAALLAESSLKKSHPGLKNNDPETLPRVWNSPYA